MKKVLLASVICLSATKVFGQNTDELNRMANIDWKEDTTEIVTIDDIVRTQRELTSRNSTNAHYTDVWSRKTYLNLSYNTTALTPDQDIPTGLVGYKVPEFESDWGASLKVGHSYALHKRPVYNVLQFNVDYTYIDLNVNHFKEDKKGQYLYNSKAKNGEDYYIPWLLEKYEFNYGMALGPSISIAPFTATNVKGLHYVKLNFYWHIGYHISLLNMLSNEDADMNNKNSDDFSQTDFNKLKDNVKLTFGHGMTNGLGLSLTWKSVGIGYEHRTTNAEHKSVSSSEFGSGKYKFKTATNRVFLQFRM